LRSHSHRPCSKKKRKKKEVVLMWHENGTPPNRQRLEAPATAVVVVLAGIVAATVVGPDKAIDWLLNYLVPVGAITGVIIAALALLVWAVKSLPNPPYRNWWL
jgi:protein-S-isoprenylcysteine O-methyltransferase Ste14